MRHLVSGVAWAQTRSPREQLQNRRRERAVVTDGR